MLVIVTESIPPRLRGWLSRLFLEVRAGVYVGTYSVRIHDLVWNQIQGESAHIKNYRDPLAFYKSNARKGNTGHDVL